MLAIICGFAALPAVRALAPATRSATRLFAAPTTYDSLYAAPTTYDALERPPASASPAPSLAPEGGRWLVASPASLTLEAADEMSNVALREAALCGFNPISVCVMDSAGRVLVHKTMPGCGNLTPEYALAKANVCVGLLCSSRELRDKYQNDDGIGPKMPQLLGMGTAAAAVGRPIAAFPGGVVCRDVGGNLVAAIGVSGAASDEDEHCSITAARAIGLSTEPAQSRLA